MGEVTFETFRAAAERTVTNLGDESDTEPDPRTLLRGKIKNILTSERGVSAEEAREMVAGKVADNLQKMLFPKEEKEIKDKVAEKKLDDKAVRRFLEIMMEEDDGEE